MVYKKLLYILGNGLSVYLSARLFSMGSDTCQVGMIKLCVRVPEVVGGGLHCQVPLWIKIADQNMTLPSLVWRVQTALMWMLLKISPSFMWLCPVWCYRSKLHIIGWLWRYYCPIWCNRSQLCWCGCLSKYCHPTWYESSWDGGSSLHLCFDTGCCFESRWQTRKMTLAWLCPNWCDCYKWGLLRWRSWFLLRLDAVGCSELCVCVEGRKHQFRK